MNIRNCILFLVASNVLFSCKKEEIVQYSGGQEIAFSIPDHFPLPHYNSSQNKVTTNGFLLGRRLFYDVRLSSDNSVSCASCHHQAAAFSDPGMALSSGVDGKMGGRNSPGLFNLAWNTTFMWDGGINHIEIMSLAPLTDPNEMNMDMGELLQKLATIPEYPNLFNKAFGSTEITDQRLFYALTQFMVMLVSSESKYDKFIKGEVQLSSDEHAGFELFNQHCAACHTSPLLTDQTFRNNGLVLNDDLGRERITLNSADRGKFKVPSLRNVALTFPYMHDGRFSTLEEVLDHYRFGIIESETLDPLLVNGIQLSLTEKAQLIEFLNTLSDDEYRTNELFNNPFE